MKPIVAVIAVVLFGAVAHAQGASQRSAKVGDPISSLVVGMDHWRAGQFKCPGESGALVVRNDQWVPGGQPKDVDHLAMITMSVGENMLVVESIDDGDVTLTSNGHTTIYVGGRDGRVHRTFANDLMWDGQCNAVAEALRSGAASRAPSPLSLQFQTACAPEAQP